VSAIALSLLAVPTIATLLKRQTFGVGTTTVPAALVRGRQRGRVGSSVDGPML